MTLCHGCGREYSKELCLTCRSRRAELRYRQALVMRLQGYDCWQIAGAMGVSYQRALQLCHKGSQRFFVWRVNGEIDYNAMTRLGGQGKGKHVYGGTA